MDMKISGSGHIPAGEYESIKISGSGKMFGFIRCKSIRVSGSAKGERLQCSEDFKVSGSCKLTEGLEAGSVKISGSFSCDGDVTSAGELKCSGSVKIDGDMAGETVAISGAFSCGGLLNGEDVTIRLYDNSQVGSIGGSSITVTREPSGRKGLASALHSLFNQNSNADPRLTVENSIEGDTVILENVTAPTVCGKSVTIGDGCVIDLVRYSEKAETVSDTAKVGRWEKI